MIDPIIYTTRPSMNEVPGGWLSNDKIVLNGTPVTDIHKIDYDAFVLDNFLSKLDCYNIIKFMENAPNSAPVSVQGNQDHLDNRIGSNRTTMWNTSFAEQIWNIFSETRLNKERICNDQTLTDWWQGNVSNKWMPVAVSPMIRYMKYQKGGQHYPHYDAGFIYPNNEYRSLMSIVIYLTTNRTGRTRLIKDGQQETIIHRDHSDWIREPEENEILSRVRPYRGRMFLFDHRMCHDVEQYDGAEGDRIIIRGDLIFKAIK